MDRHLNTIVSLSNRITELKEKNSDLIYLNDKLKESIDSLEKENKMLREDLKELNQFVYGKEKANTQK